MLGVPRVHGGVYEYYILISLYTCIELTYQIIYSSLQAIWSINEWQYLKDISYWQYYRNLVTSFQSIQVLCTIKGNTTKQHFIVSFFFGKILIGQKEKRVKYFSHSIVHQASKRLHTNVLWCKSRTTYLNYICHTSLSDYARTKPVIS